MQQTILKMLCSVMFHRCPTLYPVLRGGMLVTPYLSLYTWDIDVLVLAGLLAGRGDLPGGGLLSGLTAW